MPKKLVITTEEKKAAPPEAEEAEEQDFVDEEEEDLDPVYNPETGSIDRVSILATDLEADDFQSPQSPDAEWLSDEYSGQLAVDVYQTEKDIVIKATIAGVLSEDLDIQVSNDMVTIKGSRRHDDKIDDEQYFYRECYWGRFSRSIILPLDVKNEEVSASINNGVLIVRLPKAEPTKVSVDVES